LHPTNNDKRREWERNRDEEIEKMTPTRSNEEIGGRSYKDYVYSPVPASSSSAVLAAATPDRKSANVESNAVLNDKKFCETPLCVVATRHPESMTEKGSKVVQFLAAAAGKFQRVEQSSMGFAIFSDPRSLMAHFFQPRPTSRTNARWFDTLAVRDTRSEFTVVSAGSIRFVERTLRAAMSQRWNPFLSARSPRVSC